MVFAFKQSMLMEKITKKTKPRIKSKWLIPEKNPKTRVENILI